MLRNHPIAENDALDPLSFILNVIWLVAGGAIAALGWFFAALVMVVSIIGIPFARAAFDNGVYTLWPFGVTAVARDRLYGEDIGTGAFGFLGNIIWFALPVGGLRSAMSSSPSSARSRSSAFPSRGRI